MRIIDADALTWLLEEYKLQVTEETDFVFADFIKEMQEIVDKQPTVDAVSVRCKDRKYCYAEGFVNVRNVCEKHYDFGNVDDDWFCADGERRTDGE